VGLNLPFDVQEALAVNLVVEDGMAGRALLHELGEDPRLEGIEPLAAHGGEEFLADRPSLPEGDDLGLVDAACLFADGEGLAVAGVEDVEILEAVAAKFRVGRGGLRGGAAFADDQFARAYPDGAVFHQVFEGQGPGDGGRDGLGDARLVELGDQSGAFGREGWFGLNALLAQSRDAFGHRSVFLTRPLLEKLCPVGHALASFSGRWVDPRRTRGARRDAKGTRNLFVWGEFGCWRLSAFNCGCSVRR